MKKCSKCGIRKLISNFYARASASDGLYSMCKECNKKKFIAWRLKNYAKWLEYMRNHYQKSKENGSYYKRKSVKPEIRRIYRRKNRYGLDHNLFLKILKRQNGKCAICSTLFLGKFSVDHDHDANYVRGLLCNSCNHGLGLFRDNVDYLKKAAIYLEKSFAVLDV